MHGAPGARRSAPPKHLFHAPAGQTLQRIIKLCEKTDTVGGYVLFVVAAVQDARTYESNAGDLHQDDSYYRMACAIDGKSGVLMVDDMAFHGITIRGSTPPTCTCARAIGGRK